MIKKLQLKNFRGFSEHVIPFRKHTVVVGANNAGKSSFIEALRIYSLFTQRFENLQFRSAPSWLSEFCDDRGFSVALGDLDINFYNVCHHYGEPPATISVWSGNNVRTDIYLGSRGENHFVVHNPSGFAINSRTEKADNRPSLAATLPQVAPLQTEERILSSDYVKHHCFSRLAPIHFRNQVYRNPQLFEAFKSQVEESWHEVQLSGFVDNPEHSGNLKFNVRDRDFVSEVGWMGHGLQIWLQIQWFTILSKTFGTLILDEPDVYLHADLQRKLVRMLGQLDKQTILTTHSSEIINEVAPPQIIVLNRNLSSSSFISDQPHVQLLLGRLGSIHNLDIARLIAARKIIMAEGDDLKVLKWFHDKLFPASEVSLGATPNVSIRGWSGWIRFIGAPEILREISGKQIDAYCILDRDYHSQSEVDKRYAEASDVGIRLHIWQRKEMENYLLVPSAIARLVHANRRRGDVATIEELEYQLYDVAHLLKEETIKLIGEEYDKQNTNLGYTAVTDYCESVWKLHCTSFEKLVYILPGKLFLKRMREWYQKKYGVTITLDSLITEISNDEIPVELRKVLSCVEQRAPFPEELKK